MLIRLKLLLFLYCAFGVLNMNAQSDTINITDSRGWKQGFWKATYPNGKLKYEAWFKDNKPNGIMKRYHDDGSLMAEINHLNKSDVSLARLFYNNGKLAAEGKYIGNLKDSIWRYYSYYGDYTTHTEGYNLGVKNGTWTKYYKSGELLEELNYQSNELQGEWKQYYENKVLKLTASYVDDKRTGTFITYYPNGIVETLGAFKNNLMEGKWFYYDENGIVKYTIEYKEGKPLDTTAIEKKDKEFFDMIEKSKGKFPEPSFDEIMPR